jgi:hypothetical protein
VWKVLNLDFSFIVFFGFQKQTHESGNDIKRKKKKKFSLILKILLKQPPEG